MFMFFLQHACRCISLSLANEISDWTVSNSANIHLESESSNSKYVCYKIMGIFASWKCTVFFRHGLRGGLSDYLLHDATSSISHYHALPTSSKRIQSWIDAWLDDIVWQSKVGWFRHPPCRSARPLYEELQQGVLSVREGAPKPPGESAAKRMLSILHMWFAVELSLARRQYCISCATYYCTEYELKEIAFPWETGFVLKTTPAATYHFTTPYITITTTTTIIIISIIITLIINYQHHQTLTIA